MLAQTLAATRLIRRLTDSRSVLGVFLPAGFPGRTACVDLLESFVEQGADILEIGIPVPAPALDGPMIEAANQQALRNGADMQQVLTTVRRAAATGVPVVVMSYWEPIRAYGIYRFADGVSAAGAAGVMIPNLPPSDAGTWRAAARYAGIHTPQFAPRNADQGELARIASTATGWIYAPAVHAATGYTGPLDLDALEQFVARVRAAAPQPVLAGIGISTPARARAVARLTDGVVIGSPVIRTLLDDTGRNPRLAATALVAAFVDALRTDPAPHRDAVRPAEAHPSRICGKR